MHVAFFAVALLFFCWDSSVLLVWKVSFTVLCCFHMLVGDSTCLLLVSVMQDYGGM